MIAIWFGFGVDLEFDVFFLSLFWLLHRIFCFPALFLAGAGKFHLEW